MAMNPQGPPRAFVQRLRHHNRHVLFGSLLALLAALGSWAVLYFLARFATLGVLSAAYGEEARLPDGFHSVMGMVVLGLLAVGAIYRVRGRFRRASDRPIFGWHVLPELILLPATLTFSVWDNLTAYQPLSLTLIQNSWDLLVELAKRGKVRQTEIGQLGLTHERAEAVCLLLQFTGLVDLHGGKEEWFYLVRSTEKDFLAQLIPNLRATR